MSWVAGKLPDLKGWLAKEALPACCDDWADTEELHQQLRELVSVHNELAELKCKILEVETIEELHELGLQIIDAGRSPGTPARPRDKTVVDVIRYLDPDRH